MNQLVSQAKKTLNMIQDFKMHKVKVLSQIAKANGVTDIELAMIQELKRPTLRKNKLLLINKYKEKSSKLLLITTMPSR